MSTPRADPPTADVKLEEQLQGLKVSEFRKLREGERATSQDAVKAERLRRSTWPVPMRKCRANVGTPSTPQVEKVLGSDPGSSHNVGFKIRPESEKKATAASSAATMKEGLPLKGVGIHEEGMSLTLEEAEFQDISERARGVFTIHEAPGDARTEGQREELDLDPELRRDVENDAAQGEQEDADNNAAENNNAHVEQLEGDGSTRYPDSENETHAATADGASWNFGVGPECWDWQYDWGWGWSYYDEVPNSLPTPSGTSAATTHTLDDVAFDSLPIVHGVRMYPLRQEQIRYL